MSSFDNNLVNHLLHLVDIHTFKNLRLTNKQFYTLSIKRYINHIDWDHISQHQKLSEAFIQQFQHKVNWDYISTYQTLSESFIEQFQHKVNWIYIYPGYKHYLNHL